MKMFITLSVFVLSIFLCTSANAQLSINLSVDSVSCFGGSDANITATVTSGSADYKYSWSNGVLISNTSSATNTITSLSYGTYTVTVTDANNDTAIASAILNQPPRMQISNFIRNNASCFGASDGEIGIYIGGGTGELNYLWSTNDTTPLIDNLPKGYYAVSVTDENNCPFEIAVNIDEPEEIIVENNQNICDGDSALLGAIYYKSTGVYTTVLQSSEGCDSTVITTLTVSNVYSISNDIHICSGDSVYLDGAYRSENGVYIETYISINDCDSAVSNTLTVEDPILITKDVSICSGDEYSIGGSMVTTPGTYYDTTVSNFGCDSITIVDLSVVSPYSGTATVEICDGDSILIGNIYRTTAGVYVDSLSMILGCDSVVTVTLIVNSLIVTEISTNVCEGDSVLINGSYQSVAAVYSTVFVSSNNCDSTVNTTLIVDSVFRITNDMAICTGDSVLLGGAYQKVTGVFVDTLSASTSCDSIITTNLTVDTIIINNRDYSICYGDSLEVGGAYQKQTGVYYDTLPSNFGCDSIVITNLTIKTVYSFSMTKYICGDDSVVINGNYENTAGNYSETFVSVDNCDSTMLIVLVIDSVYDMWDTINICEGDSALVYDVYQNMASTYTDTYFSESGCDSVTNIVLNIHPIYSENRDVSICSGDSILIDGIYRTEAGQFVETYPSVNNCDSVIYISLSVNSTYHGSDAVTICSDESVTIGGVSRNTTGVYDDVFYTPYGCDSIITVTLTVNPAYESSSSLDICAGDSALIFNVYQKNAGTYTDAYTTAFGCDSNINVVLNVHTIYSRNDVFQICSGDSIFVDGAYQKSSGTFTENFTSVYNCDSIVYTSLTVTDTLKLIRSFTICEGDSVKAGSNYLKTTTVDYDYYTSAFGCDSVVITNLTVNPVYDISAEITICENDSVLLGGSYQSSAGVFYDYLTTKKGCDSTITTTLSVNPIFDTNLAITICENDSILLEGSYQNTSGVYYDYETTQLGCDSLIITELTVNPIYALDSGITICNGDSVLVNSTYYKDAGQYVLETTSSLGCDSIVTLTIAVNDPPFSGVALDIDTVCVEDEYMNLFGLLSGSFDRGGLWSEDLSTGALTDSILDLIIANVGVHDYTYLVSGNGVCNDASTTVSIEIVICGGISENSGNGSVTIYPNPVKDEINLAFAAYPQLKGRLEIRQIDGKIVYSSPIEVNSNNSTQHINVSDLPQGIYLLQLRTNEFVETHKLIINR